LLTYINWRTRVDFYPEEEIVWVYYNATDSTGVPA
jgi:hypothetical protein